MQDKELNIKDFIFFIRRNIRLMLLIFSAILLIGIYNSLSSIPVYSATATIIINNDQYRGANALGFNVMSDNSVLEDKINILKSRVISESAIKSLLKTENKDNLFLFNTRKYKPQGFYRKMFHYITQWTDNSDLENYNLDFDEISVDMLDDFVENLKASIHIENIRDTNILNVSIESFDPEESAILVNTFVDSYISKEKEWANLEVFQQISFLKNQLSKKKIELEQIENDIKSFQEKESIYDVENNSSLILKQFVELDSELVKQRIELKDLEKKSNIYNLEIEKENIPKAYQLSLKDSLRKVDIYSEILQDRIENIEFELSKYQISLDSLPKKNTEFIRLVRLKNILESGYSLMMSKLQESEITAESQIGSAKVIDYAVPNYAKIKPNIYKDLFIALVLGVIASFSIATLVEYFNNSIKTVEDLESKGLSVLSVIPSIKTNKSSSFFKIKNKFKKVSNSAIERRLIASEDPKSPISESYRTLRTSIMYSNAKDTKTIMVSSPGPGEGKTTTIANLAITYANLNKKVLLIDTDLRKPVIDKIFNVKKEPGLTNYLVEDTNIKDVIKKTNINNLFILPAGVIPPNPSELIDSDEMKELVEVLKQSFDMVLFDTPPIIAVTDALIISKYMDKFVLVCRSAVTQKDALNSILKRLENIDTKLDGCVLNDLKEIYTYGSGYYYSYYQTYYGDEKEKG